MGKQADNFIILRRKPVVGYDISFLATVDHVFNVESKIRRQTIVDFIIYFIREIDKVNLVLYRFSISFNVSNRSPQLKCCEYINPFYTYGSIRFSVI